MNSHEFILPQLVDVYVQFENTNFQNFTYKSKLLQSNKYFLSVLVLKLSILAFISITKSESEFKSKPEYSRKSGFESLEVLSMNIHFVSSSI